MTQLNPRAVLLIAFATVTGYLLGSWSWGLWTGLALVLVATFTPDPLAPYDALVRWSRKRKRQKGLR